MANEIPPPIVRFRRIARIAALVSTGWAASGISSSGADAQEPVDLSDPRIVPETEADVPPDAGVDEELDHEQEALNPTAPRSEATPGALPPVGTPPLPAPTESGPPVVPPPEAPTSRPEAPAALGGSASQSADAPGSPELIQPAAAGADLANAAPAPSSGIGRAEYRVVPGDTLWSIAKKLLGPSAAPAEIAREVDRLWRLNADRIGRWNPNLIHAGVVLRLR
jgi:nucleoid-associated protein YgaU